MLDPARTPPSALLAASRVVAVLRAPDAAAYGPVVRVLVNAGIRSIELTMTTPGTLDAVAPLSDEVGDAAEIGVGTVRSADVAEQALARGATYLVTPTVLPDVVAVARRAGRPVYPGAFSPTEVAASWESGASAVKLFPASALTPRYLDALRGPLPDLVAMPSGGVALADVGDWLAAGAFAVSLGGELIGDAFRTDDLRGLADRARLACRLAGRARSLR